MNEHTNEWMIGAGRSGNGPPIERLQHHKSLEPRCSRVQETSPEASCLVCSCWAVFLPSQTPSHSRCSATGSRLNLQTGLICWRLGYLLPQWSSAVGKSTVAKPSAVPCQVENHLLPQVQEQFKLVQAAPDRLLRTFLCCETSFSGGTGASWEIWNAKQLFASQCEEGWSPGPAMLLYHQGA